MYIRLIVCAGIACLLTACSWRPIASEPVAGDSLQQAVAYLWSQQSEDGGWHSETHGILRGGEAVSPFVLYALLQVPTDIYPREARQVEAGLAFIRRHINEMGIVGCSDPDVMEYPNYATAYALRILTEQGIPSDSVFISKMTTYLAAQQYEESRGINQEHPAYGGWGFGEQGIPSGYTGHLDISHTRKILEALNMGKIDTTRFQKAAHFLALLQKLPEENRLQPNMRNERQGKGHFDGGFYSSPVIGGVNKGKEIAETDSSTAYFRSYATATCDGLLALLATGAQKTDARVVAAQQWLDTHDSLEFPAGIDPNDPDQWHLTLVLYHLWVRSEVYAQLGGPTNWQTRMQTELSKWQHTNGAYYNPDGARNKEDDPLLATAMAIMAMEQIRKTNPSVL